jgi:hypothetical protein
LNFPAIFGKGTIMKAEDIANDLLAALAADLGLDPAALRLEDGYACLAVDKTSVVHLRLKEDSRELDLFMELGHLPQDNREAVLADMLQGNVFFQATEGGALGYDQARGIAVLTRRAALAGLDSDEFRDLLERFLAVASFWSGRVLGDATAESFSQSDLLRV